MDRGGPPGGIASTLMCFRTIVGCAVWEMHVCISQLRWRLSFVLGVSFFWCLAVPSVSLVLSDGGVGLRDCFFVCLLVSLFCCWVVCLFLCSFVSVLIGEFLV